MLDTQYQTGRAAQSLPDAYERFASETYWRARRTQLSLNAYFVNKTTLGPNSEYVAHYGSFRNVDMTLEDGFQRGGGREVQWLLDTDDGLVIKVASFASIFFFQRNGDTLGARALPAELPPHMDDVALGSER